MTDQKPFQYISTVRIDDHYISLDIKENEYTLYTENSEEIGIRYPDANQSDLFYQDDDCGEIFKETLRDTTIGEIPNAEVVLPIDTHAIKFSAREWLRVFLTLVNVAISFTFLKLSRNIDQVKLIKSDPDRLVRPYDFEISEKLAKFLMVTNLIYTHHDNCLFNSLLIFHFLRKFDVYVDVYIAVRLYPFQAHSWVQYEDRLIGDQLGHVGQFRVILDL